MDAVITITKSTKSGVYEEILPQIRSLLEGETDLIANLANTTSVLKLAFPETVSWVGFYLARGDQLVLGPFQGKPACVRIQKGKGVCGAAAQSGKTLIVPDVEQFPGHIACDPNSRSEIVVPILKDSAVLGVIDLDSTSRNSFDEIDKGYLEEIIKLLLSSFQNSPSNDSI